MTSVALEGSLKKTPTGIRGFDEITYGGLPQGRPTLLVGTAGAGKTLFCMEFIARGAAEFDEPGVYVAFEETPDELTVNFACRGFNVAELIAQDKIAIDYVYIERSEIEETGEFDLEPLFIRLAYAIDRIGAKRVVLDTLEVLFSGLSNVAILRAEMRRLFRWLKEKGVTAIVTGERAETALTRYGLEEYVADCVVVLDHRLSEQVSTRRLCVVKYRGSKHGTNEYPFLVNEDGITVLPVTSLGLNYEVSTDRVSSGVPGLDEMLGGKGYYRASSIYVTGTAGTGKSTLAAAFVDAACRRGEKCVYLAFEESASQIMRNMTSVGMNLQQWVARNLLIFRATRPTIHGLETHLAEAVGLVRDVGPSIVVVDPISNLSVIGSQTEVRATLMRLTDALKMSGITTLFTSLSGGESPELAAEVGISTLMDAWISLRNLETAGERNRGINVLKSRGMGHSNRIREFVLSDKGINLLDIYVGPEGLVTGTQREIAVARQQAEKMATQREYESRQREIARKEEALEARISAMRAEFESEKAEVARLMAHDRGRVVKENNSGGNS